MKSTPPKPTSSRRAVDNLSREDLIEIARFPDMNPGPVLRVDIQGKIIMSNAAAKNIFGDLLSTSMWPNICEGIDKNAWDKILSAKEPIAIEQEIGEKHYIFNHRRDQKSNLVFIFGSDITDHKKAERKLRESDELVRLLLNSTGDGIYGIDLEGNCIFANPACAKILGFNDVDALLDKQMHKLVHRTLFDGTPCDLQESRIYKSMIKSEGVHVVEEQMFRQDDTVFPAEYWSYPVEQEGKLIGCVVSFMDISERKVTEKLQENYMKALSEIASFPEMNPGPVLRISSEGKILMANKAAHNIFSSMKEGSFWKDICPGINVDNWGKILKTETCSLERNMENRDYVFTHRRDFDNDLVFVFGADITDQKHAETALQQAEKMAALGKLSAGLAHELNNPASAAGRSADQLIETMDRIQSVYKDLSKTNLDTHIWEELSQQVNEFRMRDIKQLNLSPLEMNDREEELQSWLEKNGIEDAWEITSTMVQGGIEKNDLESLSAMLSIESFKPVVIWLCRVMTVYNLAGNVVNSMRSISKLVDVVKSYSHMDRAPAVFVDIHIGIEDTLNLLESNLQNIQVIRQYEKDLPKIQVVGSEFNQVWTILIDNALNVMGEKGVLTISSFREGKFLTVTIADNGPGIPKEIHAQIFEPFFTTKDIGKGTGLGLNVVQRIIKTQYNGKIEFQSQPGETVFKVCIPIEAKTSQQLEG